MRDAVNLTVPEGTLDLASEFYQGTLGLVQAPVPEMQRGRLAWFNISTSGQQIHVAFGPIDTTPHPRHPCFKISSPEKLLELRTKIWQHFERGGEAAPTEADEPGEESSAGELCGGEDEGIPKDWSVKRIKLLSPDCKLGSKGVEYPTRFFARDYAGNRLEFSL
ncbi:unnamed protein product [Diplocarpon coronariae]